MATKVKISTAKGDIIVRLYDETPRHRDNFIKLAREGYFDGTLFHRVIKDFMIQGGDPDSKGAPAGKNLGAGGPDYTIPAEFVYPKYPDSKGAPFGKTLGMGGPDYPIPAEMVYPQRFHKRGALSAARLGDEVNPNRESSGSQFYIVWGKTYKPAELKQMERQMGMAQEQQVFNTLVAEHRDEIMNLRRNRDHYRTNWWNRPSRNVRKWAHHTLRLNRLRPTPPWVARPSWTINILYLERWKVDLMW